MGVNISSISQLNNDEHILKFCGKKAVTENDPFWNKLLSFTLPPIKSRIEQVKLEEITNEQWRSLVQNNPHTGNFSALVRVFLSRAPEIKASVECGDKLFVWQAKNAVFIIKHICKFLVENVTSEKIIEQFEAKSLEERKKDLAAGMFSGTEEGLLDDFLIQIFKVLIDVPILDFTYDLHMEAVTTLLVLLSVQMFLPSANTPCLISTKFLQGKSSKIANEMARVLLTNFIEDKPVPEGVNGGKLDGFIFGFAASVATSLWSAVAWKKEEEKTDFDNILNTLSHQSLLLLLVLINQNVIQSTISTNNSVVVNCYKESIQKFRHLQGTMQSENTAPASFHINLSRLYQTLCNTQSQEASALLLYALLHKNSEVKAFVLSKTDSEKLVIPILQVLYLAPEQNSHHIYMALIILLILTEDDHFNQSIHDLQIKSVPWYKDRMLTNVSLGDLMILVIVRTIQFNMTQMRDRYLHTNCLAALANMSAHFKSLHTYAAQRIFALFTLLSKKQKKLLEKISQTGTNAQSIISEHTEVTIETQQSLQDDLTVVIEVIRMLLEILNSCLTGPGLRHNANLVYALLQQRAIFHNFRQHNGFQDVLQNIDTIINFFGGRLDQLNQDALTMDEVHDIIKQAMLQLPNHRLKKFPELKFRYVEEESPEEFFVPYIWSLVFNKANAFWNPGCVQLFHLDSQ